MSPHSVSSLASVLLIAGALLSAGEAIGKARPLPVGVQLYSLRTELKSDLAGTLTALRAAGVRDVELYSLHELTAEGLRKELNKAGLRARAMHQPFDRFATDLGGIIKDARTLGVRYVGIAWVPHEGAYTADRNQQVIQLFNEWGAKCKKAGLRFFYHPHGYEFARQADGQTLFDHMLAQTKPGIVDFEMDVFWFHHGGADPVAYMTNHPKRFPLTHLKDMKHGEPVGLTTGSADNESNVVLGTGQIDITGVVKAAKAGGHLKWHFLEDESSRAMGQIPQSLTFLRNTSNAARGRTPSR